MRGSKIIFFLYSTRPQTALFPPLIERGVGGILRIFSSPPSVRVGGESAKSPSVPLSIKGDADAASKSVHCKSAICDRAWYNNLFILPRLFRSPHPHPPQPPLEALAPRREREKGQCLSRSGRRFGNSWKRLREYLSVSVREMDFFRSISAAAPANNLLNLPRPPA